MAILSEVLSEVLDIVPRTDKTSLIRRKINAAIRYISASGYFWQDIIESTLGSTEGVDSTALTQSITITSDVRNPVYLRSTNSDENEFTFVTPDRIVAAIREELLPIYYITGSILHIKHAELTDQFLFAYYSYPAGFAIDGTDDDKSNWVLDRASSLVVDIAAAYVLAVTGESSDSSQINKLSGLLRPIYIRDFIMRGAQV